MRFIGNLFQVAVLFVVLFGPIPPAQAQTARQSYEQGKTFFDNAQFVQAKRMLQKALAQDPAPKTFALIHLHLGLMHAIDENHTKATADFKKALAADPTVKIDDSRFSDEVLQLFAAAKRELKNEKNPTAKPSSEALHPVGANPPIAAPSGEPVDAPKPRKRLWTWIALGASAAALGFGIGFHVAAKNNEAEWQDLEHARMTTHRGTVPDDYLANMDDVASRIDRQKGIMTGFYVATGVFAVTSAVLFCFEGRPSTAERADNTLTLVPLLGPQIGLTVLQRF